MEKTKKTKHRRFAGLTLKELIAGGSFILTVMGVLIGAVLYFERKFSSIDHRFEAMDRKFEIRFDSIDRRLDNLESRMDNLESRMDDLEVEVKKTSSLLNSYLTWRFLYIHDPKRKNIEPRYNPNEKTLEFADKGATKSE